MYMQMENQTSERLKKTTHTHKDNPVNTVSNIMSPAGHQQMAQTRFEKKGEFESEELLDRKRRKLSSEEQKMMKGFGEEEVIG